MAVGVLGCRNNGSSELWAVGIKTRTLHHTRLFNLGSDLFEIFFLFILHYFQLRFNRMEIHKIDFYRKCPNIHLN